MSRMHPLLGLGLFELLQHRLNWSVHERKSLTLETEVNLFDLSIRYLSFENISKRRIKRR